MRLATLFSVLVLTWALTQNISAKAQSAGTHTAVFDAPSTAYNQGAGGVSFVKIPLDLAKASLNDLGVVDVNADGWLDIVTTNHNSPQSLLVNQAGSTFQNQLTSSWLDHNRFVPGWENRAEPPTIETPGLYIYRDGINFVVEWNPESPDESVSGQLKLATFVTLVEQTNVTVTVTEEPHPRAPVVTTVLFSATGEARLAIDLDVVGIPLTVTVDPELPVTRIFVGSNAIVPRQHKFTLRLRDRHGMAWASVDDDDDIELFVSRGGLRGIDDYVNVVEDELFQSRNLRFRDVTEESGIEKGFCRGRNAHWIDLDHDGLLDLFVACFSDAPQFWRQEGDMQFSDVSGVMAATGVRADQMIWVDVDGDLTAELVTIFGGELTVYEHDGLGPLTVRQTVSPPFEIELRHARFALADYDQDGDPDLFLSSSETNNALFVNEAGSFVAVQATSIGLPQTSTTANWVDYDNDGVMDLHLIPQGLFRQQPDHTFVAVPIPKLQFSEPVTRAWATWFDYNNDGARDVIAVVTRSGNIEVRLLRSGGVAGHWLEVDLTYAAGNLQAIGAVVRVSSASGIQTQWVGQSEGSHFSQGHYRLYFGLGDDPFADMVEVTWPDGSIQEFGRPAGDEIIQIDFESALKYGPDAAVTVEASVQTPGTHVLTQAYPNPFNPEAQFTLSVAHKQQVDVALYNTLGQQVAILFNGSLEANTTERFTIDGSGLASGMYLVRVVGEAFTESMSVTLLK